MDDKDVHEVSGPPIVAQYLAGAETTDVEVPVRAEPQTKRAAQAATGRGDESIQERAGLPVVAQDAVAPYATDVEVTVRAEGQVDGNRQPTPEGEDIQEGPCPPIELVHAVCGDAGHVEVLVRAERQTERTEQAATARGDKGTQKRARFSIVAQHTAVG